MVHGASWQVKILSAANAQTVSSLCAARVHTCVLINTTTGSPGSVPNGAIDVGGGMSHV